MDTLQHEFISLDLRIGADFVRSVFLEPLKIGALLRVAMLGCCVGKDDDQDRVEKKRI